VYPFHHLAQVLELDAGNEAAPFGAVILLRSGSSRAAVQVDDILGGQEIVIKNIGPQLARVPGVTGAAVLGSGETVLILNPLLLTERHLEATAAADAARALQPLDLAEPQAVEPEPERQRSVLVVDDSLTVRKITDRLLTREGYRVLVAKDGVEALEKLRDQLPDVVITDVEMPRMDGFDLVRNVRSDDHLKSLPVIMITSRTAEKHRQHASDIGVDVFLGKPYEEGELLRHIAALAQR
jgi:chemosensory pili system protein ChpA (sensor histidine kinase/response regulator)